MVQTIILLTTLQSDFKVYNPNFMKGEHDEFYHR